MPCRSNEDYDEVVSKSSYKNMEHNYQLAIKEADKVTNFLCTVLKNLPKDTIQKMYDDIPYLMDWHTKHKKTDQERTINFYKQKYPDWSIHHIMKMLDDGILPSNI